MPPPDREGSELDRLGDQYRRYAALDMPALGSPIYAALCARLAEDPQRGGIALAAPAGFRTPNILLAAVHHLLLAGEMHPLGRYYPTVAGDGAQPVDAGLYPAFVGFLDQHRAEVEQLVATRSTQTNDVGRSILILPALNLVQRETATLGLLDVGSSAGLNQLLDRYAHRLGDMAVGDPASPVLIRCEARGELAPPEVGPVTLAWRSGLDTSPLDVRDPEAVAWLRALVWPEHRDRMAMLEAAIGVARADPPSVWRGDLIVDLPRLADQAPGAVALAVVSTSVLAYVGEPGRHRFMESLRSVAAGRADGAWLVACEAESVTSSLGVTIRRRQAEEAEPNLLSLHRFLPDGTSTHQLLASCHPHGRWMRWMDSATGRPA